MRYRYRLPLVAMAASVALLACGDGSTEPPAPVATTISLSPASITLNAIGSTQQLTATVRDQNGEVLSNASVSWSAEPTSVATVSSTGLVTAAGNGSATVTASSGSATPATVTVTVEQTASALVKISGDEQTGAAGSELGAVLEVQANDGGGHPIAGKTVTFTVAAGGGGVGAETVATGSDGRAATTWTLGATAGAEQRVTATLGAQTATFTATAVAGSAAELVLVSGDGQAGAFGEPLADSLVVEVRDGLGNHVPGVAVTFAATSGGGSVSPGATETGADGLARTRWTLGASGPQAAAATSAELAGSPVEFTATATALAITAVAPDPLIEGETATITGTGFDPIPANNVVRVDGLGAVVSAASPTHLEITVPVGACRPARTVGVQVTVDTMASNTVSTPLRPGRFVELAVGEQQILVDPDDFCLQFDAASGSEAYLVGVQSAGETPAAVTPTRLISELPAGAVPGAPLAAYATAGHVAAPLGSGGARQRLAAHREAEREIRRLDEKVFADRASLMLTGSEGPVASPNRVPGDVEVGDTITSVRIQSGGTCNGFNAITTIVRAVGARSIWLEDIENPANGYAAADYSALSDWMDDEIYGTSVAYFGDPGDLDENDRIVIVVTKEVNKRSATLLGFVISCDFFPRGTNFEASNHGEYFYIKAPDPGGTHGSTYTRQDAMDDAPFLIAHELTHIIQFGRRIPAGGAFTTWLFEGQATLAEEVVGHSVGGRSTGQNYGFSVAWNDPRTDDIFWYQNAFVDLAVYFGFDGTSTQVEAAPHECTWVGRQDEGNAGPCLSGRAVYGTPWSLYRWVSDHFGPAYPDGEQGLHRDIIGNTAGGLANLSQVVGVRADTLLAQWAAALYVDDRVPGAADRLTFTSWNFNDIFGTLIEQARLHPTELPFDEGEVAKNVRDGSTAYFRVSGTNRPETAIRARSDTDGTLPAKMTLWVVRLQ